MVFLLLYLISLPLQLLTTGSLLEQGSTPLVALTAIHVGIVVALFWALLANAIVATQVVEDGSFASLVVRVRLPFLCHALSHFFASHLGSSPSYHSA
jgi:uncharacterized membrane protein